MGEKEFSAEHSLVPDAVRKSLGLIFTTTPAELTEEVQAGVPAIDVNLQKGSSNRPFAIGRLQTRLVQSNLTPGLRWDRPLNDRLFLSVGDDMSGWFDALLVKDVFSSQACGLQNFPNVSLDYRLTKDLQFTLKGEAIPGVYYRSTVGSLAVVDNTLRANGVAASLVLEQPFYGRRHVSLGFRVACSNFNRQF